MPVPIALNDILEVKVYCQCGAQAGINVRHFVCTAVDGEGADLIDVLAELATAIPTAYKDVMSNEAQYEGLSVQRISPEPASVKFFSALDAGVGDSTAHVLPTQVSGIITLTTDQAGRAKRGRMYVPFPSETHNLATGVPSGAYVALLEVIGTIFSSVLLVGALPDRVELGPIIHQKDTHQTTPITDATPRSRWATQRRRGAYGTPNLPPL